MENGTFSLSLPWPCPCSTRFNITRLFQSWGGHSWAPAHELLMQRVGKLFTPGGSPVFNSRAVSFALNHSLFQTALQVSALQFQSFTDSPFNLKEQNQCQRYKEIALLGKKSYFNLCLSGDFLGKTRLVGRFVFKTASPLGRKHLRGRNWKAANS